MKIPFEEYLPDHPDLGVGSTNIKNVIPAIRSYRSFPTMQVLSSALGARCQGAIAARDNAGVVYNYAADADTIYQLQDASYTAAVTTVTGTDISFSASSWIVTTTTDLTVFNDSESVRISGTVNNNGDYNISGTPSATVMEFTETTIANETAGSSFTIRRIYNTDNDENWEFIKWKNQVFATNYADPVQFISMGASAFADAVGGPPKARHIGKVDEFVVLGNTENNGSADPARVYWCGLANPTTWTGDAATQADTRGLEGEGGAIQHISSGDTGYVFQEYSIWTMNYIGPPYVFQINEVEPGRGALTPKGQARLGRFCFYIGQDGFYVFDGIQSTPIGANKVDKTFFNDFDNNYISRVTAAIDHVNQIVVWAYPGEGNTDGNPNRLMVYNWTTKRWSYVEVDTELVFSSFTAGYTLDSLDALSTSVDALPFPLDSRAYMGGALLFSAFDTSNKLNSFNGTAMTATLTTQEFQFNRDGRAMVTEVDPIVNTNGSDTASTTLRIGYRNNQRDSVTWTNSLTDNARGVFKPRKNARYHRFELTIVGPFQHAQELDIKASKKGGR